MSTTDKEKLASNNLTAQLKLYADVAQNYSSILHHVCDNGTELMSIIKKSKKTDTGELIISKEYYDKLFDIASNLADRDKHSRLGILAKEAVPDNKNKLEIIGMLRG